MLEQRFGPDTEMSKYKAGFVTAGGTMFYFFLNDVIVGESDFTGRNIVLKKAFVVETHLITFHSNQGPGAQFINRVQHLENVTICYDSDGFVNNNSDILKSINEIMSGIKTIT